VHPVDFRHLRTNAFLAALSAVSLATGDRLELFFRTEGETLQTACGIRKFNILNAGSFHASFEIDSEHPSVKLQNLSSFLKIRYQFGSVTTAHSLGCSPTKYAHIAKTERCYLHTKTTITISWPYNF
jgi:hypothetical protein